MRHIIKLIKTTTDILGDKWYEYECSCELIIEGNRTISDCPGKEE